jgi:hypothetical protein
MAIEAITTLPSGAHKLRLIFFCLACARRRCWRGAMLEKGVAIMVIGARRRSLESLKR